jgi:phospholipid/cholesterol/gamma-HCH transport system ATP-binding protein
MQPQNQRYPRGFAMSNEMAASPTLEFQNVGICFGELTVLEDVSFRLEPGEVICITGLTGSGKTVLLRTAAGLETADSGRIFVQGREIEHLDEDSLLDIRSRLMGFVFQDEALFTGMSVFENTAFRLSEHGWSEEATEKAVNELLAFVGLNGEEDKLPEELSGGMRRRLEFARALVGWPKVMFYDEPTAGLDPVNSRHILDLIIQGRDLHGISGLFVSKELNQISYLCHHVAVESEDGVEIRPSGNAGDAKTSVLVLEKGRVGFHGSWEAFSTSDLAGVIPMTHPERLPHQKNEYVPTYWKNRDRSPENESAEPKADSAP